MTKGTPKESDINKKSPNKDNRHYLAIEISEKEKTYFERLASLLSKIEINGNKLLPDNTLNSLGKMALGVMTSITLTRILIQSELAKTLPDKKALNEFVAFRREYMNFSVDKQIADLKRVGIVK
jgi:hypothetical protein